MRRASAVRESFEFTDGDGDRIAVRRGRGRGREQGDPPSPRLNARGARAAAVLALVGFVNIPIIKFSVDWWNTLHQPASVTRLDAPAIDPAMLTPLLLMALARIYGSRT